MTGMSEVVQFTSVNERVLQREECVPYMCTCVCVFPCICFFLCVHVCMCEYIFQAMRPWTGE